MSPSSMASTTPPQACASTSTPMARNASSRWNARLATVAGVANSATLLTATSRGGELSPHCRSVSASISGTNTPSTRLSSGTQASCMRRRAAAEAVLQARITRSQPASNSRATRRGQVVDVIGVAHPVGRMRVVAQIDQRQIGQPRAHRVPDRQPAQPAVEDPYRHAASRFRGQSYSNPISPAATGLGDKS